MSGVVAQARQLGVVIDRWAHLGLAHQVEAGVAAATAETDVDAGAAGALGAEMAGRLVGAALGGVAVRA